MVRSRLELTIEEKYINFINHHAMETYREVEVQHQLF
jgi:hypothetical protein